MLTKLVDQNIQLLHVIQKTIEENNQFKNTYKEMLKHNEITNDDERVIQQTLNKQNEKMKLLQQIIKEGRN